MEILKLTGLVLCETGKFILTRKFDQESFWNKCIGINIVYTKFFQSIASKYNLHTAVHNIPYMFEEMELPKDIVVGNVIGSGLISIVYESTKEGVPVVVKIKRYDIENRIYRSLDSIQRMLNWINWVYPIPILCDAYDEIADLFCTQLDFSKEIKNQKRFQSLFANNPNIIIPRILEEDCTDDRIVMTRLEGIPLTSCTIEQKRMYANLLTELILQGILQDGFIHADLHVGNLLFQEKTIGVIDFGLMLELSPEEKTTMTNIIHTFALQDFEKAATYTFELVGPEDLKSKLTKEVLWDLHAFIIHTFKQAMQIHHNFRVGDVISMNQKLRRHGLCLSPLFSKIMMSLNSIESVLTQLSTTPAELMMQIVLTLILKRD
jgi:predicted unusual protein kinase regulating ubiquinone biosynthesis (AarF/ABC1/UbiB family)